MINPYEHLKEHESEVFSYRELCELLNEEFKRGKGKELHLNKLRQFLDLDQKTIPRKIVLKEVYQPSDFKITGGKGKLFPFIKNILLNQLQSKNTLQATYSELFTELGLATEKYVQARYNYEVTPIQVKPKFNIDTTYLSDEAHNYFLTMTGHILKESVRSAFRQMESKNLITIQRTLMLYRSSSYWDESEDKEITYTEKYSISAEDYELIDKIADDVVKKYGLPERRMLFFRKTHNEKIVKAQLEYERRFTDAIEKLGYEFSTPLFILSITDKGRSTEVDERFLDRKKLRNCVFGKLKDDLSEFEKVIPRPLLNDYSKEYFSLPFYHKKIN